MSSALDAFRAQQEAVEALHARLVEVRELVRGIKGDADALVHADGFRKVLQDEERWLRRAEDLVTRVQYFRQAEASRFWPAVWRRWAVAIALATITGFAGGAGYVWAGRPYELELASLRERADLGDFVARRILSMTPVERRQCEAILTGTAPPRR
jgi:hypothetical protein